MVSSCTHNMASIFPSSIHHAKNSIYNRKEAHQHLNDDKTRTGSEFHHAGPHLRSVFVILLFEVVEH